jgi:hypothetical protein
VNASTKKIGLFTSIQGEMKKEGEEENKREKENKPINNHFSVERGRRRIKERKRTNQSTTISQ